MHTPDGSREIAFNSVNTAVWQSVSGINFPGGDSTCGQTGWITESIDVSQWAGTDDTLTLTVHDVGDTIYDTAVLLDGITYLDDVINLNSGQILSDSVLLDEWKYYKINTTSSDTRVSFDLTHLSDDVDMYVRKGSRPTLNDYDCRPFKEEKWSETCSLANFEANTWYVGIHGNKAGSFKIKALIGEVVGWSSDTGFREADSDIREGIVQTAKLAIDGSSGLSTVIGSLGWLTDIAGGDGQRMRNAITMYHNWRIGTLYSGYTDEQIRTLMITAFAGSGYQALHQGQLVDRIIDVYNNTIPQNDEETLQYLGICKQCLEWAMTIASEAGGRNINYLDAPQFSVANVDVRPGMGYYHLSHHAMIIIDIYHDNKGNPIQLKVAESNYGTEWSNPIGQIPWQREISTRDVSFGYTIVNYDQ